MKRHPKHARPLWGAPKRKASTDWRSCYSVSQREAAPVTVTISIACSAGPAEPYEIAVLRDGAPMLIPSGSVFVYPGTIEVSI